MGKFDVGAPIVFPHCCVTSREFKSNIGNQFFKNVLSTDLLIKTHPLYSGEGNGSRRIDRRRATHNEVERRRRDTINAWIMQLGKDFLRN